MIRKIGVTQGWLCWLRDNLPGRTGNDSLLAGRVILGKDDRWFIEWAVVMFCGLGNLSKPSHPLQFNPTEGLNYGGGGHIIPPRAHTQKS